MTPSLPRVAPTGIVIPLLLSTLSMMPTGATATGALLLLLLALGHGLGHAEAAAHVGSLSSSLSQSDSSKKLCSGAWWSGNGTRQVGMGAFYNREDMDRTANHSSIRWCRHISSAAELPSMNLSWALSRSGKQWFSNVIVRRIHCVPLSYVSHPLFCGCNLGPPPISTMLISVRII